MGSQSPIGQEMRHIRRALARHVRWVTRVPITLLSVFVVLHVIYPPAIDWINHTLGMPPPSLATSVGLALLVAVLERVFLLEDLIGGRSLRTYAEQHRMYSDLERRVQESGAKSAHLIQYSSQTCLPLIRALLYKGAKVALYIQDSETAGLVGSQSQRQRIDQRLRDLPNELSGLPTAGELNIYKYRAPASIAGVLLDEELLGMGWYVYRHVDETNKDDVAAGDKVQLLGHNMPAVLMRAGNPGFDCLYECFRKTLENIRASSALVLSR